MFSAYGVTACTFLSFHLITAHYCLQTQLCGSPLAMRWRFKAEVEAGGIQVSAASERVKRDTKLNDLDKFNHSGVLWASHRESNIYCTHIAKISFSFPRLI